MGLTLSPVNQVTTEGLPVLFIKDLPPVSDRVAAGSPVRRSTTASSPTSTSSWAPGSASSTIPSGEANVYTTYEGKGGVPVGNLLAPAACSPSHFGSSKILLSRRHHQREPGALPPEHHRPGEEGAAVPPVRSRSLPGDRRRRHPASGSSTPTPRRDGYPYAQRLPDGTSYMRNSVKLVIDAYDGSLTAYVAAPNDPLIRTWARIFPGIFSPAGQHAGRPARAHPLSG